jgi:hypothetical protein
MTAAVQQAREVGRTWQEISARFDATNTPLSFEAGDFVTRITFRDDRTIAGLYILNPEAAGAS